MTQFHPSVLRVQSHLMDLGINVEITHLLDSARTAADAAQALGIEVGQVASSIVFKLPDGSPLLIITSGRHRVDTDLVAKNLGVASLLRADADFIRERSGFAIGGVSPIGWTTDPVIILIDSVLNEYGVIWAAAGHPHAVFPTTFDLLLRATGAREMIVGE